MTKQKETQKKEEFKQERETQKNKQIGYTKQQIVNSKKYCKYKDLLITILKDKYKYSNKEIDIKIREFLERKV